MTGYMAHRAYQCRCMTCRTMYLRRANAAREVMRTDPYADPLLLLSYVVWPGPIERAYIEERAA